MNKYAILIPIGVILFLVVPLADHLYAAQLLKVSRSNNKDIVQLFFNFDKAPGVKSSIDNRRIDLIFADTEINPDFVFFDTDENIVKILPHKENNNQVVSLFFRYKPQDYKITPLDKNTLVFEVLLGNEYSTSYQKLAERLKGLTVLDRTSTDLSNPYLVSPYSEDWISFFAHYEAPVQIKVPVHFSLPPFPLIALLTPNSQDNVKLLGDKISELAQKEQWDQIGDELITLIQSNRNLEDQKLLALTYGEILARSRDFKGAFTQFYLLHDKYKDELIGSYSNYMLIYLKAVFESAYLAHAEITDLIPSIGKNTPLYPYLHLLRIDLALASEDYKTMNSLLQQRDIALPPQIAEMIQIREADYWHAIGQTVKAYAAYSLQADSPALNELPHSLNSYCETQYEQKKFSEAARCYKQLSAKITDKEILGLVSYRESMSRLKIEKRDQLIDDFGQIENAFPGTEAGWRAALKRADLLLLKDRTRTRNLLKVYEDIARDSVLREIREEALFKVSLCHYFLDENSLAVSNTQRLLRDFQTSNVRIPAQAFLIKILPGEIKRLVDNKQYIEALVLAKQNKIFFQNNWINGKFLVDIAAAYQRIGIYDEAQKLYLYLIETMPVDKREQFYLPMIQATFDHGNYALVEDYAEQYVYNYPDGQDREQIILLRIQALLGDERFSEALEMLPDPLPQKPEFYSLAASLYFRSGDFLKTISALSSLEKINPDLNGEEKFMIAESLYRTEKYAAAESKFSVISEDNSFYDQSLYRLAQLARQKGDEKKALTIFEEIVEKGKSDRWKGYAERELQIAKAEEVTRSLL